MKLSRIFCTISSSSPNRHEHRGVQNAHFLGGVPCPLHRDVYYTKVSYFFKMRKFSGVHLQVSLIFQKFYNIMKYIINIIFIGVSGL